MERNYLQLNVRFDVTQRFHAKILSFREKFTEILLRMLGRTRRSWGANIKMDLQKV
jgi:hypothetical protein